MIVVPGTMELEKPVVVPFFELAVQVKRVLLTVDVRLILVPVLLQMTLYKGELEMAGNESTCTTFVILSRQPSVEYEISLTLYVPGKSNECVGVGFPVTTGLPSPKFHLQPVTAFWFT